MSQIINADFEKMLEEQNQNSTKRWTDLEKNEVYTIEDCKITDTQYGESIILILSDDSSVWAPGHLKEKIKQAGVLPPYYVRPLGLKACMSNRKNKYHAYNFVVPEPK